MDKTGAELQKKVQAEVDQFKLVQKGKTGGARSFQKYDVYHFIHNLFAYSQF